MFPACFFSIGHEGGAGLPEVDTLKPTLSLDSKGRDTRLDFWRGLCLIDMVLVHLIYADVQCGVFFGKVLTDYTRFAAGGFVFLSGLLMGTIFLPKAIVQSEQSGHAWPVYRRIWARAGRLLIVQYITTTLLMLMDVPTGGRAAFAHPMRFVTDLLRCRTGNDLLMLYVGMLAVTPLLLELLRRHLWPVIAMASILLFGCGTRHPWRLEFVHHGEFPVLLWQAVFVSGLLFTYGLRAFDRANHRYRVLVIGYLGVAFAIIFQSANAGELGMQHPWLHLRFWKIPLTFGEYLRYTVTTLLLMLVTNAFWGHLKNARLTAFIRLLGRNSLFVYVSHLYLQEVVASLAYRTWAIGPWQLTYAIAMIALLGAMAFAMERFAVWRKISFPTLSHPSSVQPTSLDSAGSLSSSDAIIGFQS